MGCRREPCCQRGMDLSPETERRLRRFYEQSRFGELGGVMTDLDGTAVHEHEGRITIPASVEHGLKRIRDLGRPLILNSLRFPLSVMRTFGEEWYAISNAPLPTVSLNGSLTGYITRSDSGGLAFEEIDSMPLEEAEIDGVIAQVSALLDSGLHDLLVFHYPRDWCCGERIWTPQAGRIDAVTAKYRSATEVTAEPIRALRDRMLADETCMVFLLVERPQDRLMAYQHVNRESFVTRGALGKHHGARRIAARLQVDLAHSVGAGDSPMDTFLGEVGLAVLVGPMALPFRGTIETIRLADSAELGRLMFRLADLHQAADR
jgi:hydroxymethylpyrimidine pyrophosphatase-like HAD family hydrolase